MSLRHALPFVALALVMVFVVARPTPGAGGGAPPEHVLWGESITAVAPALPEYAANANVRIEQQLASANAMWTAAFAADGREYEPPTLAAEKAGCGAQPGWAGMYCDGTIVIDVAGHVTRHDAAGQAMADTVLGYVVAHEAGHHVQALRGAPRGEILRLELHADCLAGVWGKAAGIPLPPMWVYGEDAEHGTAAQRVTWLNEGYRAARPAACDKIFSSSISP